VQLEVAGPLPASVQAAPVEKPPEPVDENATLPLGWLAVPFPSVSVTVAVQVVGWPTTIDEGEHPIAVEVARVATLTVKVVLGLVACAFPPP
jgi:hypothetical protein